MAAPGVDPEIVARAWELHAEGGRSVRYIGEKLGVSHQTAANYVQRGRDAQRYIEALDREDLRVDSAARLRKMFALLVDEIEQGAASAVQVVPVMVQVEARLARLMGLDAPTRLAVSDGREQPAVDADTVSAIRAVTGRNARDERELRAGDNDNEQDTA